ncbi:MAG: aminodeoxychorismate synthase component I [Pyrinomonadaceae bacterium]|nr:aminodeoxychorismate synthase component I [Pyrinomonadaceae bacterium]
MREIEFSADELVAALLNLSKREQVCLLDSGGVANLGSHLLIAGITPLKVLEITNDDPEKTLAIFDAKLSNPNIACIFTISYDFGLKLQKINSRPKEFAAFPEPDVFLAAFDCLIIHDYDTHRTVLTGNEKRFDEIEKLLSNHGEAIENNPTEQSIVSSNFTRQNYLETIEKIQEYIRRGDTYQTNLTQQLRARLPENLSPPQIFNNLRKAHPAAFAAFIKRENDCVISASPERFFRVERSESREASRTISASPIKGTRPRGKTIEEDLKLRNELLNSEKDRAENVMIVDLLRNDLGRICEFGSVAVEKLCELEEHPTLFHLVSTIRGELRGNVKFSDILKAVFPCGSITGAPKIRTMQIIDELETAPRGLSMGAIGCSIPNFTFQNSDSETLDSRLLTLDLNVAIRTMVVKNGEAIFNVGGGITIDSVPAAEYEETLVKAQALLNAVNGKLK